MYNVYIPAYMFEILIYYFLVFSIFCNFANVQLCHSFAVPFTLLTRCKRYERIG